MRLNSNFNRTTTRVLRADGGGGRGGGSTEKQACRVPCATTAGDQNSNNTSGVENDVVYLMHDWLMIA